MVNNDGDFYTITEDVFVSTYKEVAPSQFVKTTLVWATKAPDAGQVETNEGIKKYKRGDYCSPTIQMVLMLMQCQKRSLRKCMRRLMGLMDLIEEGLSSSNSAILFEKTRFSKY